ncbi:ParB/RepB/Spo0J family partition protein [Corynebacterium sp. zg254]|uniref:ParB/RepB/Spo0J family partition protein n=2 Tax=Corynebacteriaceae TaxID=1653 RepID=A0ABQ6VC19_9CORY|nr:ParB/RepB/Spo0J family partition protein [Corynebacterium zhongnanshanii]MCR5915019.1 ParB/RepB/Spo0J family partition protein [Corynebacterium sp. zg254]
MPNMGGTIGSEAKRGGLGRGLASLIPTGDQKPRLGHGAADIILGPSGATGGGSSDSARGASKRNSDKAGAADKGGARGAEKGENSRSRVSDGARGGMQDAKVSATASGKGGATGADEGAGAAGATNEFGATYQELPLASIRPNAKQPRSNFDEEALAELVHSIREFGVMQPIVVRYSPDGSTDFELIMGERRFRASKEAGLDVIPAIVRETDDSAMLRDALLENIHRAQLNPLEEAAAYQQLLEEFGVTQAQLAERIGRSRPLITNMIRLLQLPVAVQRRVAAGVLSAGHARALLGVKVGADAQERLALRIVAEGLSVRATEEAVTALNRTGGEQATPKRKATTRQLPADVRQWADDFGDALDTKVSVQMGKKKGKIVVEFGGPEDFERIIELINYSKNN